MVCLQYRWTESGIYYHVAVPIYDVRKVKDFDFVPEQLRNIKKLPHWVSEDHSDGDLESNKYIATVAYTVNTFPSGGRETGLPAMTAVLLNVLFVMILGHAA
jgi:hypothetical protein